MKAKYLGHDEDGAPRRVEFAGASFPKGVFVDVSHLDHPTHAKVLAKLKANPFFEYSDDAMTKAETQAAEDVNGGPAETEGDEPKPAGDKAAVIAALEALQAKHPEVKFNPKAKAETLQAVLEAAQFEYGED